MAEDEDPNIISKVEKKKANPEIKGLDTDTDYSKYAVGGESIISKVEKKKANPEIEGLDTDTDYSKYAVGGESIEVPASTKLDENDNRRKKNESKQEE